MQHVVQGIALMLLCASASLPRLARADAKQEPGQTPARAKYKKLTEEFQRREQDFIKQYKAATTAEEKQKLLEQRPRVESYSPRLLELAEKYPNDPFAYDALVWVATLVQKGPDPERAIEILTRRHLRNENIGQLCNQLVSSYTLAEEKLLRAVLEKNPNPEIQAIACLSLARQLKYRSRMKALLAGLDSAMLARIENEKGKEFFKLVEEYDSAELQAKAEEAFDRLVREFGHLDVNNPRLKEIAKSGDPNKRTLKDLAIGPLFELRNLSIGKVAPDIEGEDIGGKKFKLSDYRGKVVVLDFWGHW
jgi:hypothetical protein